MSPNEPQPAAEFLATASEPPAVQLTAKEFVKVSTTVALGPMGYVQMPSGPIQLSGTDPNLNAANKNYNFPSLYIYISASPLLLPKLSNPSDLDSIQSVQDGDRDINWLDATFDLTPVDSNGQPLPCDENVQVLGLLPGTTVAGTKTPAADTAATAASQLMTALAPFFPTVKTVAEGATSALQVLFTDLFPPKSVAYQYSFLDGNCSFGWYFKPNANSSPATSVLGTQTGLVLLRTSKSVATIRVSSRVLSSWTKPPSASSKQFSYVTDEVSISIPNAADTIDFGALQDLSLFPMLIPVAAARQILHITSDSDWQGLVQHQPGQSAVLQTTPDGGYVIKASLQAYLQPSGH